MKYEWRTQTVIELCEAIREEHNFEVTPILADALQDAGCDDEEVLNSLRTESDQTALERLVAIVYSDESHDAVKWMDEFVATFGPESYEYADPENLEGEIAVGEMTYKKLMEGAKSYLSEGWSGGITQQNGQSWQDVLLSNLQDFWDKYEKITGSEVEGKHAFIGCSC